jgi:hypothetical protein
MGIGMLSDCAFGQVPRISRSNYTRDPIDLELPNDQVLCYYVSKILQSRCCILT